MPAAWPACPERICWFSLLQCCAGVLRYMLQAVLLRCIPEDADCLRLAMQRTAVPNSATRRAAALLAAAEAGHARGAGRRLPSWHVWQRRIRCATGDSCFPL